MFMVNYLTKNEELRGYGGFMTGSEYCKQEGLESLVELSNISTVPVPTLNRMWHNKRYVFECLVAGAVSIKSNK